MVSAPRALFFTSKPEEPEKASTAAEGEAAAEGAAAADGEVTEVARLEGALAEKEEEVRRRPTSPRFANPVTTFMPTLLARGAIRSASRLT